MTTPNPITPPPELVQEWIREKDGLELVVARAAQYGADQELEACCEWLGDNPNGWVALSTTQFAAKLRATRRPKPPSLKEQALEELEQLRGDANSMGMGFDAPAIRRALEALPD